VAFDGHRRPYGNRIEYSYERDFDEDGSHRWDQLYLRQIVMLTSVRRINLDLVTVELLYEERPTPPPIAAA
jgi:hypothetical protein